MEDGFSMESGWVGRGRGKGLGVIQQLHVLCTLFLESSAASDLAGGRAPVVMREMRSGCRDR